MTLLTVLDVAGSFAARESLRRQSAAYTLAGMFAWLLAFCVYTWALKYADLAPLTLGWVVLVQVAVVLLDRFWFGSQLPQGWPVVVALMLAGQVYLTIGSGPAA